MIRTLSTRVRTKRKHLGVKKSGIQGKLRSGRRQAMKNWQSDAAAKPGTTAINIESDADADGECDGNESTAEHDLLLPAPTTLPLSSLTSLQQQQQREREREQISGTSGNTSINMEHLQPATTSNGLRSYNSVLATFLARQRSYTPVSSTPVRSTAQINRRLQQSRSVSGGPSSSIYNNNNVSLEEQPPMGGAATAPAAMPAAVRQLGFWRVNLNEMFTLSTAPSTEALRSFIAHSNFRNQGAGTGTAGAATASAANVTDNTLNENEASTSASISMGRSISLREGEMQQPPRHSLNTRHTASVLGLSMPASPSPPADVASTAPSPDASPSAVVNAGNDPANEPNNAEDDDHIIVDMVVQVLSHFVRYLPIICILLVKFVHDHLLAILDLMLLQSIMYSLNRSLRFQVARLVQRNYKVLLRDACLVIVVVTLRLFMASAPPDPLGLLVPPPNQYKVVGVSPSIHTGLDELAVPTALHSSTETLGEPAESTVPKVIPLGVLLYYVAVSDLLLKLLTILVKIGITMMPLHMIRLKVRARLYVLVENISQFYRALTPITQWFHFLYESYSGMEVISGGLLSCMYLGAKIFELLERGKALKKAIATFRRNIDSERPPTKEELEAAGSVCPICHDSYSSPIILECGHIFCDECVQTWFKREQTCPMCRAKVSDDPAWQDGATTFFHQLY